MVTSLKVQVSLPSCDDRQHPRARAAFCVTIQWHQEGCHLVRGLLFLLCAPQSKRGRTRQQLSPGQDASRLSYDRKLWQGSTQPSRCSSRQADDVIDDDCLLFFQQTRPGLTAGALVWSIYSIINYKNTSLASSSSSFPPSLPCKSTTWSSSMLHD